VARGDGVSGGTFDVSRRTFLRSAALAGAGVAAGRDESLAQQATQQNQGEAMPSYTVPRRPFGKTGEQVSIIGVGGFHLGATKDQQEANALVGRAIDSGINFFDNAWEYKDGVAEERLGTALKGKRDRVILMTKVCTHGRDKSVAMQQLEQSLRRLGTDHLDVWQIHEVVYYNDPDLIFRPDGAIEALAAAKQQGKVRWVGFTGHKDPNIHLKMLSHDFPFDTVQMPLNPFDGRKRRDGDARGDDRGRGPALCDEPAGGDDDQRNGFAGSAGAEPGDCRELQADGRGGAACTRRAGAILGVGRAV
jgi:hypothetical protein